MKKYANDLNTQMLISLLKLHGIRKVIASPGTTNIAIVGSMQHDEWFEMYSAVDERSAGYMACGLACESGEPVIITCTEATASRNYFPALTEAYYRKLPILVIAGCHGEHTTGHLNSQVIDRSCSPNDTVIYRTSINPIKDNQTKWYNNIEINRSLIKLRQHGGGPVLMNFAAKSNAEFDSDDIPQERFVKLITDSSEWPSMPNGRIAVFIGSHVQMTKSLQDKIDEFCSSHNSVVFCDHTSGYQGVFRFNATLVHAQFFFKSEIDNIDLLIHIGEVSGDTYTTQRLKPITVWRVSPDGEIRDLFKKLSCVFEMDEMTFFSHYASGKNQDNSYFKTCQRIYDSIYNKFPEIEFGNIYIAKFLSKHLPKNSVIHFGIYNSLRSWNFFQLDPSIQSCCNVGGFGIDGACSTLIGASLANPQKIHFLSVGDLAFFYDLNSLGNRHVGNNIRIILINNGRGVEFRKKDHPGCRFGDEADLFISAAGHFGEQSTDLVRHYATDLGFEYLSATNKTELEKVSARFLIPEITEKPMLLEVFPHFEDDVENLDRIRHILSDTRSQIEKLGDETKTIVKKGLKTLLRK